MARICVYAGSRLGTNPAHADAARRMGTAIAERGWTLVYGGGGVGLMRVVADAALAAGGEVIGVIPGTLAEGGLRHPAVVDMRVVDSMHARKSEMARLSDAFAALPGGFGTLEELFEIVTWHQLGLHSKPVGVLNAGGWFDPASALVAQLAALDFIPASLAEALVIDCDPERLLARLAEGMAR